MKLVLLSGAGVLASLVAAELSGLLRRVADRLLRHTAQRLPIHLQERWREEWLAEIDARDGMAVTQVVYALLIRLRLPDLRVELGAPRRDVGVRVSKRLAGMMKSAASAPRMATSLVRRGMWALGNVILFGLIWDVRVVLVPAAATRASLRRTFSYWRVVSPIPGDLPRLSEDERHLDRLTQAIQRRRWPAALMLVIELAALAALFVAPSLWLPLVVFLAIELLRGQSLRGNNTLAELFDSC